MAKFAVSLDEPCASFLLSARFDAAVRERTRRSGSTSSNLVEFAGYMREVLR